MNYYLLYLFVILLPPFIMAKEVTYNSTLNSLRKEGPEETRKKPTGEVSIPMNFISKVIFPAQSFMQSLRRLLKAMRKWCHSHPPEVKLARCFASYFNIKIPGLRRYDQLEGYNDYIKGKITKRKTSRTFESALQTSEKGYKILGNNFYNTPQKSIGSIIVSTIHHYLYKILETYRYYRDKVVNNQLIVCTLEYVSKKFWIWIDTAPDS